MFKKLLAKAGAKEGGGDGPVADKKLKSDASLRRLESNISFQLSQDGESVKVSNFGASARGVDNFFNDEVKEKSLLHGRLHSSHGAPMDVLSAVLSFKKHAVKDHHIPKDRAAWLEYLVALVKRKTSIEYLSDKELRKVITRARPNLGGVKSEYKYDVDAPVCLNWDSELVAEWVSHSGFPYLKEAFLINNITGRKLINVDCSALNQMGMTDLSEMRKLTAKIRDLLKITKPNMLRALMRIPPLEEFIKTKVNKRKDTDGMTFEKFCKERGFNYALVKNNKNALIPCTCEVRIVPLGVVDEEEGEDDSSDDSDLSLRNAPTVEYIVRNAVIRDKTVSLIIEEMMQNVFLPNSKRKYGKIVRSFLGALYRGYEDLDRMDSDQRFEFAEVIAKSLMDEMEHTAEVLSDIDLLQRNIDEQVSPEILEFIQDRAWEFMEHVLPIVHLLVLGELDLENIFRQEPEFNGFVDGLVMEAEQDADLVLHGAQGLVKDVTHAALRTLKSMGLPGLPIVSISSGTDLVLETLKEIVEAAIGYVDNDDTVDVGPLELTDSERVLFTVNSTEEPFIQMTHEEYLQYMEMYQNVPASYDDNLNNTTQDGENKNAKV